MEVNATARDAAGWPVSGLTIRVDITGSNDESIAAMTESPPGSGNYTACSANHHAGGPAARFTVTGGTSCSVIYNPAQSIIAGTGTTSCP